MIEEIKKLGWILFWLLLAVGLAGSLAIENARAAGTATTAQSVTCAAAGSSTQVLSANATRESYVLSNTSGATIRLGFLSSGTADLTDSNSIKLLAGQIFSDSAPSIFIGRLVCMSDDATPDVVYVIETRRQ